MSFSNPKFFKLKGNSQKPAVLNKENSVFHSKKIFDFLKIIFLFLVIAIK